MADPDIQTLLRDADKFLSDARLQFERAILDQRDVAGVSRGLDGKLRQLDGRFSSMIRLVDGMGNAMGGPQQSKFLADTQAQLHAQYTDLCQRAKLAEQQRGDVDGRFQQQYNQAVIQGLAGVRGTDVKGASKDAIKGALRQVTDKLLPGSTVPGQYKDQISDALAGAIVDSDDLDGAFVWAQQVLIDVTSYVQRRITFPAKIRSIADTTDGVAVQQDHMEGVQDGIQQHASAARDLDAQIAASLERSKTKVSQSFSFNPNLVLDPTVRFVKSIDAKYEVTITKNDVLVKLSTGLTLDRPLEPDAKIDLSAGLNVQFNKRTTLDIGYSSSINNLYNGAQYNQGQVFVSLKIKF
jgi:hypothetical protein